MLRYWPLQCKRNKLQVNDHYNFHMPSKHMLSSIAHPSISLEFRVVSDSFHVNLSDSIWVQKGFLFGFQPQGCFQLDEFSRFHPLELNVFGFTSSCGCKDDILGI